MTIDNRQMHIGYAYSGMEIDFDPRMAAANLRKHRVSFEEAASYLLDPRALAMEDQRSEGEARWVLVGMSGC